MNENARCGIKFDRFRPSNLSVDVSTLSQTHTRFHQFEDFLQNSKFELVRNANVAIQNQIKI